MERRSSAHIRNVEGSCSTLWGYLVWGRVAYADEYNTCEDSKRI